MAAFEDLPSECIVMILSYLRPHHIEALAKTFDKRVTKLCLPFLGDRTRATRNDRIMKQFFGDPYLENHEEGRFDILLENLSQFSVPEYAANHLGYLQMDGDLEWLVPLDDYAATQRVPHWGSGFGTVEIEKLRHATQQLGVCHAVPRAFWTLMNDIELRARIPSFHGDYFTLGPLCKILVDDLVEIYKTEEDRCASNELDESEERNIREIKAYIVDFYSDSPGIAYWHLYIDSQGHHCVLGSPSPITEDWNDEAYDVIRDDVLNDRERGLGVKLAISDNLRDASLVVTDFETWLAYTYFMQRARCMCNRIEDYEQENDREWISGKHDDCAVLVDVAEFVENVFTEEGRKRQMFL